MPVSLPGARDGAQRRPRFGEEKPKVTPNQRLDADRPPFSPRTHTPIPLRRHFSPTPLRCPFSPFAPSGIPQRIDPTEIPSQNPPPAEKDRSHRSNPGDPLKKTPSGFPHRNPLTKEPLPRPPIPPPRPAPRWRRRLTALSPFFPPKSSPPSRDGAGARRSVPTRMRSALPRGAALLCACAARRARGEERQRRHCCAAFPGGSRGFCEGSARGGGVRGLGGVASHRQNAPRPRL